MMKHCYLAIVIFLLATSLQVKADGSSEEITPEVSSETIETEYFSLHPRYQKRVTLTLRDNDVAEVMEMLAKMERVNIVVGNDVEGSVSINLYDVTLDQAIRTIANSAGFGIEFRDDTYFVVPHDSIGKHAPVGTTLVKTYKVQYSDPEAVVSILENYLSEYGSVSSLNSRKLIVVEDVPEFIRRIEHILYQLDRSPAQVLIEARVLEVTLDDSESYGIDWKHLFKDSGGEGMVGIKKFNDPESAGFFLTFMNKNIELAIDYLRTKGRVRTLSTPKLLVVENNEAEVIVGDRLGFKVTTTINEVTNESIEFLESGVILRVTPHVDNLNRILLHVHPEVSTGTISDGIPNQTTSEVTTQLLLNDGETSFIGGLLKQRLTESRESMPILGDLPLVRLLFSKREEISVNTETIVLITPHIVKRFTDPWNEEPVTIVMDEEHYLQHNANRIDYQMTRQKATDAPRITYGY